MPPSPRSRISCRRRRMRPSGSPIDGGILRPNGRAAPRPAPFARPRPSKACSPFHSSVFLCLSGASAGRSATVRHPEHLQPDATASLAPQVAAQSPFFHLPPFRRAPPSLAVSVLPSPTHTSRPSPPRLTPGALISVLCALDSSALRLPAGSEKQTYCSSSGSAAAMDFYGAQAVADVVF